MSVAHVLKIETYKLLNSLLVLLPKMYQFDLQRRVKWQTSSRKNKDLKKLSKKYNLSLFMNHDSKIHS